MASNFSLSKSSNFKPSSLTYGVCIIIFSWANYSHSWTSSLVRAPIPLSSKISNAFLQTWCSYEPVRTWPLFWFIFVKSAILFYFKLINFTTVWNHLPSRVLTNQVNASSKPVPYIAEILNIDHCLYFKSERPRPAKISCSVIAPGKSYLLASTRTGAPFNSSSWSMMSSSCFEYSSLSLSVESTTKITALVSW